MSDTTNPQPEAGTADGEFSPLLQLLDQEADAARPIDQLVVQYVTDATYTLQVVRRGETVPESYHVDASGVEQL